MNTTADNKMPLIKLNGKIPSTIVSLIADPVSAGAFKKYVYIGKKTK
jgi:hypothetical protein